MRLIFGNNLLLNRNEDEKKLGKYVKEGNEKNGDPP